MNVYDTSYIFAGHAYGTRAEADFNADTKCRIAVIRIEQVEGQPAKIYQEDV